MWEAVPAEGSLAFTSSCRLFASRFFATGLILGTLLNTTAVYAADEQNAVGLHSEKGLQLAHAGDLAGAESELRTAIALAPNNPEYLSNLAIVLAIDKKLEESTGVSKKALKLNPANQRSSFPAPLCVGPRVGQAISRRMTSGSWSGWERCKLELLSTPRFAGRAAPCKSSQNWKRTAITPSPSLHRQARQVSADEKIIFVTAIGL